MGEYIWKTYAEVNALATNFGRGIRELGNKPKMNVVIFAETRAEWMIAAHGLFKQNIPGTRFRLVERKSLKYITIFKVHFITCVIKTICH